MQSQHGADIAIIPRSPDIALQILILLLVDGASPNVSNQMNGLQRLNLADFNQCNRHQHRSSPQSSDTMHRHWMRIAAAALIQHHLQPLLNHIVIRWLSIGERQVFHIHLCRHQWLLAIRWLARSHHAADTLLLQFLSSHKTTGK